MYDYYLATDCTTCPCLSICNDGESCNLNYDTNYRRRKSDNELVSSSTECKLQSVQHEAGIFTPIFIYVTI